MLLGGLMGALGYIGFTAVVIIVRRRRRQRRREEALEFVRSLNAKAADFYVDEKGDIRWK